MTEMWREKYLKSIAQQYREIHRIHSVTPDELGSSCDVDEFGDTRCDICKFYDHHFEPHPHQLTKSTA